MAVALNCNLDYFCNNGDCVSFKPTIDTDRYYEDGKENFKVTVSCDHICMCSKLHNEIIKNLKANEEIAF